MTTKLKSGIALLSLTGGLAAVAATPEDFPSLTKEIALTSWNSTTSAAGPTGCSFGPFMLPVVGAKNPLCRVTIGALVKYATLDFPPTAKTAIAFILTQPNEIDAGDVNTTRPLTLRVPYTRLGGQTGISSGGVCTGECSLFQVEVFSQIDGSVIGTPIYGPFFQSDLLQNGGNNFPGKKITAAVRSISFPVTARNPLIVKLTRDPAIAGDTSTGTLRLTNPLIVVWPIVRGSVQ
jgi:hypothetical protein